MTTAFASPPVAEKKSERFEMKMSRRYSPGSASRPGVSAWPMPPTSGRPSSRSWSGTRRPNPTTSRRPRGGRSDRGCDNPGLRARPTGSAASWPPSSGPRAGDEVTAAGRSTRPRGMPADARPSSPAARRVAGWRDPGVAYPDGRGAPGRGRRYVVRAKAPRRDRPDRGRGCPPNASGGGSGSRSAAGLLPAVAGLADGERPPRGTK